MNNRDRFINTMNFHLPDDRLPVIEWATWWDLTLDRWRKEGLPHIQEEDSIREYLGTDYHRQFWISPRSDGYPDTEHAKGAVSDLASYEAIRPLLYPDDAVTKITERLIEVKKMQDKGDAVVWLTLEGFFWFPRTLFGIEEHLYSFYDEPELMHMMNQDLTDYHMKILKEVSEILSPDFITFAEDMSYNHGPMISRDQFNTFLLPYYRQIIPAVEKLGTLPFVDTDGQVEAMIPWLIEAGIKGVLPLERQSGVDVVRIRKLYPEFLMIGAFDKTVMHLGKEAMQKEFERLLPVMRTGGFIPSCDHQTPPDVSLETYREYVALLHTCCGEACR